MYAKTTIAASFFALSATTASAAQIYADTVIDYFHSGVTGPASGSFADGFGYGGPPVASTVPLSYATDQNLNTYISLPTGSYITLGFSTGFIFDGTGDDLFVDELGNGGEDATLFVSTDFGATFTELTTVFGDRTNRIDFADFAFTGEVNAVKLLGLDNGGSSPGFDLTAVYGLDGSTVEEPQGPVVPVPASLPLLLAGVLGLGWLRRSSGA